MLDVIGFIFGLIIGSYICIKVLMVIAHYRIQNVDKIDTTTTLSKDEKKIYDTL